MKTIISLLALTLSIGAFAQERVVLTSKTATVFSDNAILVRTSQTPKVVQINFSVPMEETACLNMGTRPVTITSGSQCGYTSIVTGYRTISFCARTNPYSGQCVRTETRQEPIMMTVARSCTVMENYCANYGTVTNSRNDTVKVKFKDLPTLGDSEEDTFLVKASQDQNFGLNVVYEISTLQTVMPYQIKSKGILGIDSFEVRVK